MDFRHRHLPHLHTLGQPLFITFRLHDSVPPGRGFPRESMTSEEAFLAMDRLLDAARTGPRHLQNPEIAEVVRDSIEHGAKTHYDLHAWVIMPNHVHLLLTPYTSVSSFMRRLKGYTARMANRILRETGQPFWQEESYDHCVRSPEEFRNTEQHSR